MATRIAWTRETCNVFTGCRKVSAGCAHCYAESMAKRLRGSGHPAYQKVVSADGWTARFQTNFAAMEKICRMPKGRMVFVCSMGDFFYEAIPDDLRDAALTQMLMARQHIWQILTKRPGEALRYCRELVRLNEFYAFDPPVTLPDHIWIGVTCEDQHLTDERLPLLLEIPSAVRFVSLEPLLGPVDLMPWLADQRCENCGWLGCLHGEVAGYAQIKEYASDEDEDGEWLCPACHASDACVHDYSAVYNPSGPDPRLDWVIVGCESINGRPGRFAGDDFYRALASLRDQCGAAGVPLFLKQIPDPENLRVIHDAGMIAERLGCDPADIRQWPAGMVAEERR